MYKIKEIYYTLQGEGFHTGRPSIFIRFSGCNLWTGLEKDRTTATCYWCDTDFVGTDGINGGKYTSTEIKISSSNFGPKIKNLNLMLFVLVASHFCKWTMI